jgi:hypothetical protein
MADKVTKISMATYRKLEKSRVLNITERLQIPNILEICYLYYLQWKYVKKYISIQASIFLFVSSVLKRAINNLLELHNLYYMFNCNTQCISETFLLDFLHVSLVMECLQITDTGLGSTTPIAEHCGVITYPFTVTSQSNELTIRFYSDSYTQGNGFTVSYLQVERTFTPISRHSSTCMLSDDKTLGKFSIIILFGLVGFWMYT